MQPPWRVVRRTWATNHFYSSSALCTPLTYLYTATVLAMSAPVSLGESDPISCYCDLLIIAQLQTMFLFDCGAAMIPPATGCLQIRFKR